MKALLFAISLTLSAAQSRSQDHAELAATLQKIISDSTAFFSAYKDNAKDMPSTDPVFHSIVTIPGTFDNDITISATKRYGRYFVTIADKATEKEAKTLIKKWKQAMKQILGDEYVMTEYTGNNAPGRPIKEYRFTRGKMDIVLFYNKWPRHTSRKKKNSLVQLYILYSPFKL
jgi:hypothetical protein